MLFFLFFLPPPLARALALLLLLLPAAVRAHCPTGKYYPGCKNCPAGRYGNGRNTGGVATNCPVCTAGKFQDQTAQTSCKNCAAGKAPNPGFTACVGNCKAGSFLSGGTCQQCPAGQFQPDASKTSCKACPTGQYCVKGSTASQPCPPGVYGSSSGLGTAACSGPCALGHYCGSSSTSSTQNACPAGSWGISTGLSSPACSGNCPAGSICPAGTTFATAEHCGPAKYYCKEGTKSTAGRIACPEGSYTTGDPNQKTGTQVCPKGHYCQGGTLGDGIKIECPIGRFGAETGLTTSACSGACAAGYHCPKGSISPTQEPCAPSADPKPASWYCVAGGQRQQVTSSTHITGPLTASERHREALLPCPPNSVCMDGVASPLIQWSAPLEACNARSAQSATIAWTDPSVANIVFQEGSGTEGVVLAASLNPLLAGTGAVDVSFVRCPTCCTGLSCVGSATPALLAACDSTPSGKTYRKVSDGKPGVQSAKCGTDDGTASACMDPDQAVAGVRCCSPASAQCPSTGVFGGSDETCKRFSYAKAVDFCAKAGARLCTVAELQASTAAGTGCWYDYMPVWTSDTCATATKCASGQSLTGCGGRGVPPGACLPASPGAGAACPSQKTPPAPFRMDPSVTGRLVPADAVNGLDAEGCTSSYYFQIQAATSAGLGATIFCQVAVSVQDVNEPPVINEALSTPLSVEEKSAPNTLVGTTPLAATDPEVTAGFQSLTWTIENCFPRPCPFRIRSCSGQLLLKPDPIASFIDYDVHKQYQIQVKATDDGDPRRSSVAANFVVKVLNRNDPPVFGKQNFTVGEDADIATTVVGQLKAYDTDEGDTVSFIAVPDSLSPFKVTAAGQIRLKTGATDPRINFESRADWTITVTAKDSQGLSSPSVQITVYVANANDPAQVSIVTGGDADGDTVVDGDRENILFREDCIKSAAGASATVAGCSAKLFASDEDDLSTGAAAFGSPLTFSMPNQDNPNDCKVTVFGDGTILPASTLPAFDFEGSQRTCDFTVRVADSGGLVVKTKLKLVLLDVNENPVMVPAAASACQVREDANSLYRLPACQGGCLPGETPTGCVLAGTDPDTRVDPRQTLSFFSTSAGALTVEGTQIVVVGTLDFEAQSVYDLPVIVRDDGPSSGGQLGTVGQSNNVQRILIIDVNEPPTLQEGLVFAVDENTPAHSVFYTATTSTGLNASDPERGTLTYAMARPDPITDPSGRVFCEWFTVFAVVVACCCCCVNN